MLERPQVRCREAVPWGQGFCFVSITQSRCLAHGHSFMKQWVKRRKAWSETFICTHDDDSHAASLPPPLGWSCRAGSSLIPTPPHPAVSSPPAQVQAEGGSARSPAYSLHLWSYTQTFSLNEHMLIFLNLYWSIVDVQCVLVSVVCRVSYTHTYIYSICLFWPCGMWDLSSLTRHQTSAPCSGKSRALTTGPPIKSPDSQILYLNQHHRGLGASVQHLLGLPVRRPEKEMGTIPRWQPGPCTCSRLSYGAERPSVQDLENVSKDVKKKKLYTFRSKLPIYWIITQSTLVGHAVCNL